MKKKVFLALVIVMLCVSALAGCSNMKPQEKVYTRNVATMADLKVATGSDFVLPTIELKGGDKFFDADAFKDAVSLPEGAKNNELLLLYVPPITEDDVAALKGKADTKMYRYSIKHTLGAIVNPDYDAKQSGDKDYKVPKYLYPYGDITKLGRIEIYVHGTNYGRVDQANFDKVKLVSLDDRKAKMEKDNKSDMKKITENSSYTAEDKALYWASAVNDGVYCYSNRLDGQVIRYFPNAGKNTSYEATACIYLDDSAIANTVDASLKGKEKDAAKAKAVEDTYKELLAIATAQLDAIMSEVRA